MQEAKRRPLAIGAALAVFAALPGLATASSSDAFPETADLAVARYESQIDDWLDGPVFHIALEEEIEAFEKLASTEERAEFIRWFWARRDNDLRDAANPFRERFYARVAEANKRYNGFPRGWRSDRGLVHIVLGRPDGVRPHMGMNVDSQVWTYYTVGPRAEFQSFDSSLGELSVAFIKTRNRAGYRIYGGFGGPGVIPRYVAEVIQISNMASIVDPFLKMNAVP